MRTMVIDLCWLLACMLFSLIEAKMLWLREWEHGIQSMCVQGALPQLHSSEGVSFTSWLVTVERFSLTPFISCDKKWGSDSLIKLHTWCYHNCLCSCCWPKAAVNNAGQIPYFLQICLATLYDAAPLQLLFAANPMSANSTMWNLWQAESYLIGYHAQDALMCPWTISGFLFQWCLSGTWDKKWLTAALAISNLAACSPMSFP